MLYNEVKDENDNHDEAKTFANYINSTYKEKFKTFTGLDDSAITDVTFPNENYNETTAIYWVDTSDLLDNDPDPNALPKDDKYVKVKVGDADKYIDKKSCRMSKSERTQIISTSASTTSSWHGTEPLLIIFRLTPASE